MINWKRTAIPETLKFGRHTIPDDDIVSCYACTQYPEWKLCKVKDHCWGIFRDNRCVLCHDGYAWTDTLAEAKAKAASMMDTEHARQKNR